MSKKLVSLVVGVAVVFALVGVTNTASAATVAELEALIASLQAQISALSTGTTATPAATDITKNLTVGSKGDDVNTLQQYLIDEGYLTIDAPTGYFGAITKKAVVAWQKDNDLPSTGYFGAMSRAKYAELNVVVAPVTPATTTATGTPTATLDNTDGSITAVSDSYVPTSVTLKKGETKDIYAVKLTATAGKVAVTRFDVRMNVRPYLYFNKLVLKDSTGTVIAEKVISSDADVTELSAGSDYLVRFDGINFVVEPNNNKIIVVSASVVPNTDKLSSPVTVTVHSTDGLRTMNGKGYTESKSVTTNRTITLSSTGSDGNIVARLSANSPLTRTQAISTSGETNGVVLGIFDLKSENQNSTIEGLDLTVATDGAAPSSFIKRLYIVDGSTTYSSDTLAASSTFRSLKIALAKDEWKSITVKADIADSDDITGVASTTVSLVLQTGNPTGIDTNWTSLTRTANTVAASKVTFSTNSLSVTGMSAVPGQGIVGVASGPVVKYPVAYTFTLTNNGNTNLYVSKTVGTMITATSGPVSVNATTTITEIAPVAAISGDDASAYVITSNGGSRTFTIRGLVGPDAGQVVATQAITGITYGTTNAGTGSTLTTGLEPLYTSFAF